MCGLARGGGGAAACWVEAITTVGFMAGNKASLCNREGKNLPTSDNVKKEQEVIRVWGFHGSLYFMLSLAESQSYKSVMVSWQKKRKKKSDNHKESSGANKKICFLFIRSHDNILIPDNVWLRWCLLKLFLKIVSLCRSLFCRAQTRTRAAWTGSCDTVEKSLIFQDVSDGKGCSVRAGIVRQTFQFLPQ